MPHIIEVVRETKAEAHSFLDALFYSDSVSAIGHRPDGKQTRAVAVNWDADGTSELDERMRADGNGRASSGQRRGCGRAISGLLSCISRNNSLPTRTDGY